MNLPNPIFKKLEENCLDFLDENSGKWLASKLEENLTPSSFYLTFGLIGRKIPAAQVDLKPETQSLFKEINPDFESEPFTLDEYCRLLLLLSTAPESNHELISTMIGSADRKELVTIFKSIQYLGNAEDFKLEMIDGLRTNMVDVFDAISRYQSFPVRFFHQDAWNQMVLKAIFMERPLFKIQGLDQNRNQKLTDTLHDFVHERWSAGRNVHPELWRAVLGFENDHLITDMISLSDSGSELDQMAVRKALFASEHSAAKQWCKENTSLKPTQSWTEIGVLLEVAQAN
ncbi:EboA domain-containing protein [Jiulongibacter sp. NS-SX5]|uniref:EboA domain-containing protein n=1 Tax=Jiulongibacter sp. NS-SX5 TaxID=3463854 RepID=UPI004058A4CA